MLDITFIRNNLDLVKEAAKNKNREVAWEQLLATDDRRRELIAKADALRAERNKVSAERSEASSSRGKEIKQELKTIEDELRDVEQKFEALMLTVPNVPDASVPVGK